MKSFLSLIFFLNIMIAAHAQEGEDWMQAQGAMLEFLPGEKYYTMVTDANLRDKPGLDGAVVAKLPIATPVTIIAATTDTFTLRGIKRPWLEVSCTDKDGKNLKGYIWGGFMALAMIQTPDDEYLETKGVMYLLGTASFDEATRKLTVQVRIANQGVELAKSEFETIGNIYYQPEFKISFTDLKNVKCAIAVNYHYEACGEPSGNNLLLWLNNNKLLKVLETSSVADGGVFYASEEYILPHEKGGIGDHILVVNDVSEYDDSGEDFNRTAQTVTVTLFKWTGEKLVKKGAIKPE